MKAVIRDFELYNNPSANSLRVSVLGRGQSGINLPLTTIFTLRFEDLREDVGLLVLSLWH